MKKFENWSIIGEVMDTFMVHSVHCFSSVFVTDQGRAVSATSKIYSAHNLSLSSPMLQYYYDN